MYRKVAYLSVMIAFSMILSYIESLVPFYFGAPGIKLGLANFIIILMLYSRNIREALLINLVRIVLSGFLFGSMFSILYSLSGGLLSFVIMLLARKNGLFDLTGVSICGGISHNIGQLLIAMYVVHTAGVLYYIPILLIGGLVTGLLIGVIATQVLKRMPRNGELL